MINSTKTQFNQSLFMYLFQSLAMDNIEKDQENAGPINYGQQKYWDQRYQKRKGERFEWLQTYARLKPQIQLCLPKGKQSRILNIGCGNSSIQQYLYQDGYHFIFNNDISPIAVYQISKTAQEKGYSQMKFDVMDVREMNYKNEYFDLIIDKSTIDSLMCSDNPLMNVTKMIEEGYRVLAEGGYYFAVSYSGSRMQHFLRSIYKFQVTKKQLKRIDQQGFQLTNHLYIARKLLFKALTPQEKAQFYSQLRQQQKKEYPSE